MLLAILSEISTSPKLVVSSKCIYIVMPPLKRFHISCPIRHKAKLMFVNNLLFPNLDNSDVCFSVVIKEDVYTLCIPTLVMFSVYESMTMFLKQLNWLNIRFHRSVHILL